MALNNYDDLVKAVIDQSHREDLGLNVDNFIRLTEAEFLSNQDEPLSLRGSEVIVTDTAVVGSDLVALPAGHIESRSLRISFDGIESRLSYRTPATMIFTQGQGTPQFYTIIGESIQFDIASEFAYVVTFQYLQGVIPLTKSNDTNNVLTKYPNLYLYGCLKQAFIWADDDDKAVKYAALFFAAIKSANTTEDIGRHGDSPTISAVWAP